MLRTVQSNLFQVIRNHKLLATKRRSSRRDRSFRLESLEDRRVLAAQPSVLLNAPNQVMIGEALQVTATFDNLHPTDAGFGPFVDLYVPVNGMDGVGGVGADGITFNSASYLGAAVALTQLTFPDSGGGTGTVSHPYAVDATGAPLSIMGRAGDQLVVMQLPFGSFTADQPAADISISMSLSNLADLALPLNLRARAGFQYGNDALNNPATDPSLVSDSEVNATLWSEIASIEPTLIRLNKQYIGPEDETATGPNFVRQYVLEVDIANGQTVTNLDVIDLLPNNLQLVSVDVITPAGSVTTFPVTPANAPSNELIITLPSVSGTTSTTDATITFSYFVPFRDADAQHVIDTSSGDDATSQNNASALGDWTPLDPRDTGGTNNASANASGPEHVLTPKSIAIQKGVNLLNDPDGNGLSPGDTLEYTLEFQVSDFFGFDDVFINDIISDGQRFDTSFVPQLSVTNLGTTTSGAISAPNFTVIDHFTGAASPVPTIDGTQELTFFVSNELTARTGDGRLVGGLVPPVGTGGSDPNAAAYNIGGTVGTLVFRTIVQEFFTDDFPSGDPSVDEGDQLDNAVSIEGDVLSHIDLSPTGETEADTSAASIVVPAGNLIKSIYAINGSTTLPVPLRLSPGDLVTYRLQLALPTSDFEDLQLIDYLPLPVLYANEVTSFIDLIDATTPAAGTAKFGPSDTFRALYGSTPGLSIDAVSNSVTFNYGDFDVASGSQRTIDILFTVTASSDPFADGLLLTNQARRSQDTTNSSVFIDDAIIQIELGMPELHLTKGIVATNNPNAVFSAGAVGPIGFSVPGSAGYRGSATLHSNGLAATPIDSDLEDVDAGDLVTFAIVVENQGSSRAGAFDLRLRDTLPAGFVVPGSGLNLSVTDGQGATISFANIGTGLFDAAGGIELADPGPTTAQPDGSNGGVIDEFHATNGRNIVIITYDLQVQSNVTPNVQLENTATLFNYAGVEAGPDFTTSDLTDPASALTSRMTVAKSVTATNQAHTTGVNVAIGEIVTYQSVITVPEGTAPNVQWMDVPDVGLSVVDIVSITPSSGALTTSVAGGYAGVASGASISANGTSVTLDFGTLSNTDTDNTTTETVTIEYRVVVLNRSTNNRGTQLNNLATISWTGNANSASAPNVRVVEPSLTVNKTIVPATGQATDVFVVTIDIAHAVASNATAFDVALDDLLPTGLVFSGNLSHTGGVAPNVLTNVGSTIHAEWNTFNVGNTAQVQFEVALDGGVTPNQTITNTANATWTSLPGDVTSPLSSSAISTERTGSTSDPGGTSNDHRASDNATIVVNAPDITKAIVSTALAHTSGQDVVIGEIVTYETTITIPQGTLLTASLVDTPTAGLAIVDVLSVTASPGLATSIGSFATVQSSAVIPANGSQITLDFGTLTNTDSNNAVDETIVVSYRAIVLNTTGNNRGTVLDNDVEFLWGTGQTVSATAADLTIVEPGLQITKSLTPASVQAGQTITVVLDIAHAAGSNADAMDLVISDVLPAGMSFAGNLQSTGGVAPVSLSESSGTITGTWPTLAIGSTSQIRFDVTLDASNDLGATVQNDVAVSWTSVPGDATTAVSSNPLSTERTGSTSDPGGSANDHVATALDQVTLVLPALTKLVTATDQSQSTGTNVVVGEIVTYQTTLTFPQGQLSLATLFDTPDSGLAIVDVISIVASSGVTTSVGTFNDVRSNAVIPADGSSVTLDFGTLTNSDVNVATTETIVVEYRAIVLNTPGNARGATLDNAAEFTWGVGGSLTADAADLTVVEPTLTVAKAILTSTVEALETFTVQLTVAHSGTSNVDAVDVVLNDALPAGMEFVSMLPPTGSATPTVLNEASGTITARWDLFPLTGTAVISFTARLASTVEIGTSVLNSSDLTWTSVQGDRTTPVSANPLAVERTGLTTDAGGNENDYNADSSDSVATVGPSLTKQLTTSNQSHSSGTSVVIGEIVTYETTLVVPQGTMSAAVLTDTPSGGLAIVDIVSIVASPSVTTSVGNFADVATAAVITPTGSLVTLDFGTLQNTDGDVLTTEEIVVTYRAVVLNTLANNRGTTLDNTAGFTATSVPSIAAIGDTLTIVEPDMRVTVSNGSPATGDAGDLITFTLVVGHTGVSNVDARDVSLQNLIDAVANHLAYEPGTLNVVNSPSIVGAVASDAGGDIELSWAEFPQGATSTITFQVRIENTAPPLTALVDTATLQWTSASGDLSTPQSSNTVSVERTGNASNPGGAANDHLSQDTGLVTTSAAQGVKSVTDTSEPFTLDAQHNGASPDVAIGELVTYTIEAVLPEGSTSLIITDELPVAGVRMEFVDVQVSFVGANLTIAAGRPLETRSDSNADTFDDTVVLDFGNILNAPDGIQTAADRVQVEIVARVADFVGNTDGTVLTNTATIDYGSGIVVSATDIDVVEPDLQIAKSISTPTGPAGTTVTYSLVISHTASSTSDAFQVVVADLLTDTNVTLIPGTVTASAGIVTLGNGASDSTLAVDIGILTVGDSVTITFDGLISPDLLATVPVVNTSELTWNSLPGPGGREQMDTDTAIFTTTPPEVDLQITKSDSVDPVSIDDPLTYTLVVLNAGPSTATNVLVTDLLPSGLTFSNATATQGLIGPNGLTVDAAVGTLRPGESVTITIDTIAPSVGGNLLNHAEVTSTETDTNPNNNQVDEPTLVVETADITGVNWVDTNHDGVLDPNEIVLPGVQLTLTGVNNLGQNITLTTLSGADGSYAFTRLRAGSYTITQTQPSLFVDSDEYLGSEGGTVPANDQLSLTLVAGVDATQYNFTEAGLRAPALSKRLFFVSNLLAGNANNSALDAVFAQLAANGQGDLDNDGDSDADDYQLFLQNLGGSYTLP
jgi:uncharacterized repeat protein (TIGR01451 family)/fimbrial isopeptide formation D2 family protein